MSTGRCSKIDGDRDRGALGMAGCCSERFFQLAAHFNNSNNKSQVDLM